MAALSTAYPTLVDLTTQTGADGSVQPVIELLSKMDEMAQDIPVLEGNETNGERATVRTGIPTPTWRLFNQGVVPTKGTTAQLVFKCGQMENWSQVDAGLADSAVNREQFLLNQSLAQVEGMSQEMYSTFWYGTAAAPEEFVGIAAHYNDSTAGNGSQVLKAGGSDASDNASIWLVNFGPDIHMIYPRNHPSAGITRDFKGKVTAEAVGGVAGALMDVYREKFAWGGGLVVRDWRRAVRIANIDVSAMVAQSGDADLSFWMRKATHRIRPSAPGTGRTVFVMHPSVFEYLDHQRDDKAVAGGGVRWQEIDGVLVPNFRGIPIRRSESLLLTEAPVT